MAFKKEIIALLRKREGVQLSSVRIEQIATVLDGEVVEEADIETAIETYNKYNPLAEIAKTDDKIRSLEKNKGKTAEELEAEKAEKEKAEKEKAEKVPTDVPPYIQVILDSNKAIADKLAVLEGTKVVNDRKSIATERFKDANDAFKTDLLADLEEMNFKDEEHFNSYLDRKEKTLGDLKQAEVLGGLGNGKLPKGQNREGEEKQATKEELDQVMTNIKV